MRPPGGAEGERPRAALAGRSFGGPEVQMPTMAAAAPERIATFMAFDFGTRRTGVAIGNSLLGTAEPLKTLAATGDALFPAIEALLAEWRPDALVVGVPRHPDGQPHEMTRHAGRFARRLRGRFGLAVHEVDERYSTTEAEASGAADVDAASAGVILAQFLRARSAGDDRADSVGPTAGATGAAAR